MVIIESPTRNSSLTHNQIAFEGFPKETINHSYILFILTAINVINLWHRNLIYNLSNVSAQECSEICQGISFAPICTLVCDEFDSECMSCYECRVVHNNAFYNLKEGACISDAQYGVLVGVAFTFMFAVISLFAGRICDLSDRRVLHTVAVFTWSLSTSFVGLCSSFGCLLVMRIVLAFSEAFNAPACYSLIAFYFPSRRSTANGIYSTGTYIGSGLSTLSVLLAKIFGWRNTMNISGSLGIFMAVLLYRTIEYPKTNVAPVRCSPPLRRAILTILTSSKLFLLLFASSVRGISTLVVASYFPLYFNRAFPSNDGMYSIFNGFGVTFAAIISSSIGGTLADRWGKSNPGGLAYVPAIGIGLGLIPASITLYCPNFYTSMAAFFFQTLLSESWLGPGMAIMQREVPRDMVGLSVAVLLFFNSITSNIGPMIVSAFDSGTESVRDVIFIIIAFSYLISAVVFIFLGKLLQMPYKHRDEEPEEERRDFDSTKKLFGSLGSSENRKKNSKLISPRRSNSNSPELRKHFE